MNNDLEQFSEERLKEIVSAIKLEPCDYRDVYDNIPHREIAALARIALSVKKSEPIGEIRLSEYRSDGTREASLVCLHYQADWDNFTDGTLLYLNPQPAHTEQVIPDGWKLVPATPSQAHLNSIAMRYRHDFYLLNEAQKQSALAIARQMYEECSGQGYFNIAAPKPESE